MKAAWLSASISLSKSANSFKSSVVTVPSSTFCKNEARLKELLVLALVASEAVVLEVSVEVVDEVVDEEDVEESVEEADVPATAAAVSLSSLESLKLAKRFCKAPNSSLLAFCGGGGGGGAAASMLVSSMSAKALCRAVKSSSVTVPFFTLSRKEDKVVSKFAALSVPETEVSADKVVAALLSLLLPVVSELVRLFTGTSP